MARVPSKDTAKADGTSELVTYRPGPEDPTQVRWDGHVFHANIPKTVTKTALIEKARKNRFFHVGPFNPATDSVPLSEDQSATPKTAEQYRAFAVEWLKKIDSVEELDTRWAAEEPLRMSCEVGTDDIEYLMDLMLPKRAELKKLEAVE